MKGDLSTHHSERGKQTEESENMISVKMGDQDMVYSRWIDPELPEADLRTLSAIN